MKKIILLSLLLVISSTALSQSGWIKLTDSIPDLVIMSMQFTSENTGYAVGSYNTTYPGGFLRTTNAGVNWQFYHFPNYSADDLCFLNDNTGFMSCWGGPSLRSYVLKTTNSGINWFCTDSLNASFFKMKFYDLNTGFVASKYSGIDKTTDGGYNWFAQTGVLWMEPSCIWCFDVDNWLIASSEHRLNKTTNGGINWHVLDFASINFYCRSLYFINDTTGFGATWDGKIFKTTNKGDNWIQISSIIYHAASCDIFFVNYNTGYVCGDGMNGNIFKTTNGGYNWIPQMTDPLISLRCIFFINPNTGYTGGQFGFIFKTANGGVFLNQISNEIPEQFSLFQNYPNPFNPTTNIKFDLKKSSHTKLIIYDILGKEVASLVNEKLNAGSYKVSWDGSGYSSGVYFYRLVTDDYVATKKMLLIK